MKNNVQHGYQTETPTLDNETVESVVSPIYRTQPSPSNHTNSGPPPLLQLIDTPPPLPVESLADRDEYLQQRHARKTGGGHVDTNRSVTDRSKPAGIL